VQKLKPAAQWISLPSGISGGSVTRPCEATSGVPWKVAWQQQQQQQQQHNNRVHADK
jgi:hypothetical protein